MFVRCSMHEINNLRKLVGISNRRRIPGVSFFFLSFVLSLKQKKQSNPATESNEGETVKLRLKLRLSDHGSAQNFPLKYVDGL